MLFQANDALLPEIEEWSRAFEEHDWWLVGAIFIGNGWLGWGVILWVYLLADTAHQVSYLHTQHHSVL